LDGAAPEENRDRYLRIALDETERLSKLANDILDVSRIQNMGIDMDVKPFDINELIRKTLITFESRVTAKEINMRLIFAEKRTVVAADQGKISRVIYNLVDNAIKFVEQGGEITVETTVSGDKARVSVRDDGKGVGAEDQKRVFERFYKADASRGEDKKGSGLGLSIVREFIKAHGGSVTLSSEPGKGCRFSFTLPLEEGLSVRI
jgi:signal transduction histidine kinase